jgi:membrane-bound ClpP family serine protease
MELFGYSLQEIYLFGLITGGILTFLYILFSDIVEGIFEAIPDGIFNPTLTFSFVTIFSATGYLLEKLSPLNEFIVFGISSILALFLVILLNIFVLVPLRSAEESITLTEDDLKGRLGKVIISIPEDGFGEVVLEGNSGTLSMSAKSFDDQPIPYEKEVLVIDVKESVLYVKAYDSFN